MAEADVKRVLAVLPQTQCQKCGFGDCAAFAEAFVAKDAAANSCPPGGALVAARLQDLTPRVLPALVEVQPSRAVIDEKACIGCAKCLPVCPIDAIVGARKLMHTVIANLCTGCELCISSCPVDCIVMEATSQGAEDFAHQLLEQAASNSERYTTHQTRFSHERSIDADKPIDLSQVDRATLAQTVQAALDRVAGKN
ncbi:MAG: RnfABCDGE type electron transport complex subunit B [Pseudomonadota bacterium]